MSDFLEDTGLDDIGGYAADPLNLTGIRKTEGEKAARANQAYFDKNVQLPELQKLQLEKYLKDLSPTELAKIQENPSLLQSQLGALNKLEEITAGGGLTSADRGRIGQIGREEAIREQGQRQSITQGAQRRGVGGSGLELSSLLNAQQGTADRAANRGIDVENLAQHRALQALEAQGNLSGQIRGQDYTVASNQANSQDIINRFNTGARNAARLSEQEYNQISLPQQRYNNQLNYFQNRSGLNTASANATDARRDRLNQTVGTAAQVVGSIYGGPAGGAAGTAVKQAITRKPEDQLV